LFLYEKNGLHIAINKHVKSEQVGYIFVTFDELKDVNNGKRVSYKQCEYALALLRTEVQDYDAYLNFKYKLVPIIT
jgi:hypothetical protein